MHKHQWRIYGISSYTLHRVLWLCLHPQNIQAAYIKWDWALKPQCLQSTLNTQHSTGGNNKYFYIHWQPSHRLTLSLSLSDWSKGPLWPLWPVGSLVEIKRLQTSEYKSWSISPDEKDLDVIQYVYMLDTLMVS